MMDTRTAFTIWNDELDGILSPLFFISKPVSSKGYIALKEVAEINPSRKKPIYVNEMIVPYVGLPETDDQRIKEIWMRPFRQVKGRNIIHKGDILFARIEPSVFNKKYIYVEDLKDNDFAFTSTEFYIVEPKENINPLFLFHMFFVQPVYYQVKGKTTGSTGRRRLDKGVFEKILIPYPNRKVQDKIVNYLCKAYEQKRKKEDEIKKIHSSIDDYILRVLDIKMPKWEIDRVYETWSDKIVGRIDPSFYSPYFDKLADTIGSRINMALEKIIEFSNETWDQKSIFDDDFPYIEIGGINLSTGNIDEIKQMAVDEAPSRAKMVVRKNDLIVSTTRPSRGAIAKINEAHDQSIASTGFAVLREMKTDKLSKDFLLAMLRSVLSLKQMEQRMTGGNYPAITVEDLKQIRIVIPDRSKQKKIVEYIESSYSKAQMLQVRAAEILSSAQKEVEHMVLSKLN